MAGLGQSLAFVWVGAACAGWLLGAWAVIAQAWWFLAVSCLVLATTGLVPPRLHLPAVGAWMSLLLVGVAGWCWRMPGAVAWVCQPIVWIAAGAGLVGRFGWRPLRDAVVWWAWINACTLPLSWIGVSLYGGDWNGTMGKRAVLAVWLAFASLWSARWKAWALAALSLATGSLSGLIALVRLLQIRWLHPLNWVAMATGLAFGWRWWLERLTLRVEVWSDAIALIPVHWASGWGLQALPVGFKEVWSPSPESLGIAERMSRIISLHSTWLDVAVRGGLIGLVCLLAVMGWAGWRSWHTKALWTWIAATWGMSWQSVGAQPALMCLAIVWLLSLTVPRRVHVDQA